ncbi:uncharacterized protein CLUP02_01913 [Colletotrichum lupini]|uniref:Uncharacterized protein n=1 Tax=Colletotrichum lupini TaxID=145971 RepID=A0A9Q8WAC9_9PEZI|nr:uncharacterized protein CLUP02_01913 [Colletotrichum lupini]UQC75260.1 hypothetical protein CLUP02_01913 [Colletotrichum lupini]
MGTGRKPRESRDFYFLSSKPSASPSPRLLGDIPFGLHCRSSDAALPYHPISSHHIWLWTIGPQLNSAVGIELENPPCHLGRPTFYEFPQWSPRKVRTRLLLSMYVGFLGLFGLAGWTSAAWWFRQLPDERSVYKPASGAAAIVMLKDTIRDIPFLDEQLTHKSTIAKRWKRTSVLSLAWHEGALCHDNPSWHSVKI